MTLITESGWESMWTWLLATFQQNTTIRDTHLYGYPLWLEFKIRIAKAKK